MSPSIFARPVASMRTAPPPVSVTPVVSGTKPPLPGNTGAVSESFSAELALRGSARRPIVPNLVLPQMSPRVTSPAPPRPPWLEPSLPVAESIGVPGPEL